MTIPGDVTARDVLYCGGCCYTLLYVVRQNTVTQSLVIIPSYVVWAG